MSELSQKGQSLSHLLSKKSIPLVERTSAAIGIPARENLKSLLLAQPARPATINPSSHLAHVFSSFLADISGRQSEWMKLNRARRDLIEKRIYQLGKLPTTPALHDILQADPNSALGHARNLFLQEFATFHLLQSVLLLQLEQRFGDQQSNGAQNTVNWRLNNLLKKIHPQRSIDRNDWVFLKQNLYSWFSPSPQAWQKVSHWCKEIKLTEIGPDFFLSIAALASPQPASIWENFSHLSWLWLKKFSSQNESNSAAAIELWGSALPLTIAHAYKYFGENSYLSASTNIEFERFVLEMFGIWLGKIKDQPVQIQLESKTSESKSTLQNMDLRRQQSNILCAIGNNEMIADQLSKSLEGLAEGGLLAIASPDYFPTDNCEHSTKIRELLLKNTTMLGIADLRSFIDNSAQFPKSIIVAKKVSSREIRDCHRPLILRIKGVGNHAQLILLWEEATAKINQGIEPGERHEISDPRSNLKTDCMAAAAAQQNLRSAAWTSIADPIFYDLSSAIRRLPVKAFNVGNLIRIKNLTNQTDTNLGRAIYISENHGKSIEASVTKQKNSNYIFVLDRAVQESAAYFAALINSSPLQFWYQLEIENEFFSVKNRTSRRHSEQILKLMPILRLFETGTLLPASQLNLALSTEEIKAKLEKSLAPENYHSILHRQEAHSLIITAAAKLESALQNLQNLGAILFPHISFSRLQAPQRLPDISPLQSLQALAHLEQVPLSQHPAFQIIPLRTMSDFKISTVKLALGSGPFSEIILYHGAEAVIRLHGPTLFIKAASEMLSTKVGKTWSESKAKMAFPLDAGLVSSQIKQLDLQVRGELEHANQLSILIDSTVCTLAGFCQEQDGVAMALRLRAYSHPHISTLNFAVESQKIIVPTDSVSSTSILQ